MGRMAVEGGVGGIAGRAPQYSCRRFDFLFAHDHRGAGEVMGASDGVVLADRGAAVVADADGWS